MSDRIRFARLAVSTALATQGVRCRVLALGETGADVRELLHRQAVEVVEADSVISAPERGGAEYVGICCRQGSDGSSGSLQRLLGLFSGLLVPHGVLLWEGGPHTWDRSIRNTLAEAGLNLVEDGDLLGGSLLARKWHSCCANGQSVFYDRNAFAE